METKYALKRKSKTATVEHKVSVKHRKKEMDLNSLTKKQLIDHIQSLKDELVKIKRKCQAYDDNVSAKATPIPTQTTLVDEEITIPCQLCIYNADYEMELRVHMDHAHGIDDDLSSTNIKCDLCSKTFKKKHDLMNHIKTTHVSTLPNCKYYQSDSCKFNEKSCWFVHKMNEPTENKCRYCEEQFYSKSEVMIHQKQEHEEKIPICKNHIKSNCKYKDKKCWFIHPAKGLPKVRPNMDNKMDMSDNEKHENSQNNDSVL